MSWIVQSRARRPLVLATALAAALALMMAIAPRAEAAKPLQILDAQVRVVNQVTCEATIDVMLNRKGSMKNDIRVEVIGTGPGFDVTLEAQRGATLRVIEPLGSTGVFSGFVSSVNPRTGETVQRISLRPIVCGV